MAASVGDVFTATVERGVELVPHVRELVLRPTSPFPGYAPGQWVSVRLPVGDKPPLIRAYSLATPPQPDGSLTLCFDRVEGGLGSAYLWGLAPGAPVELTGPFGNFVAPAERDEPLVLVARYTGVVPFRAMLRAMDDGALAARPVRLVVAAPTPGDLVYHAELTGLAARAPWLEYLPIVAGAGGAVWGGPVGGALPLLRERARGWMPFRPMVCGVREFTLPVRSFFQDELGFERRAVKVENYSGPSSAAAAV
jgi:ferredoxin-NADP reductase